MVRLLKVNTCSFSATTRRIENIASVSSGIIQIWFSNLETKVLFGSIARPSRLNMPYTPLMTCSILNMAPCSVLNLTSCAAGLTAIIDPIVQLPKDQNRYC